ncbi:Crp/Fnr family transcriptional regulator [Macrococcus armenti]|uniref:Crp/Fnr family transcriptional regulator n=1 Tax=Macrococcus armenti TaxID=2875764 RepID=UPI001CCAE5CE|nr:Crp/Fnr family transcriptional regulator [Macrococcus armenti]UBH08940.1 Crp/Fnr family transcriptional regulator [Macrococcus armenti]UBH11231.1 Crp/Fnr family transcriptional regulator [Macrococcus armenti]UBH15708.1 Crp/Fnr family transcriptional regulator [Macrococcus armenti]UBH18068.1 Crp/Fnr family transcriptional regulator [Macrococcus armenti]UBH20335.1 Crp/Fnr family transcriptional regulator [Macrococcus armenti]
MKCHLNYELCVQKVPIFNHLDKETMQLIFNRIMHRTFAKKEHIYLAGDIIDSLYVVHKGRVRIYKLNENGEEQLIRILSHGDYTGEISLFNPSLHNTSYAEVIEDAEICIIQREDIYQLMHTYPVISITFIETFAERLAKSEEQTTNISLLDSRSKLLMYIESYREGSMLNLSLTKKHIASYLSMQPETLNRTFNKLEEEQIIQKINHKTYRILKEDLNKLI